MVNPQYLGSVAARALVYFSARPTSNTQPSNNQLVSTQPSSSNGTNLGTQILAADKGTYSQNTASAVTALQGWYNKDTGLWKTTGWWNAANCLQVLMDFTLYDRAQSDSLGLRGVASNTFTQAQQNTAMARKVMQVDTGMVVSAYEPLLNGMAKRGKEFQKLAKRQGFGGFINDFYDDEGWWALAWIRSYDNYKDPGHLDIAENIFEDMRLGGDNTCGGGIWWSKQRNYKNAIANQLYLAVAASLSNRAGTKKSSSYYRDIAVKQWAWLKGSGMINKDNLFNDGLTIHPNGSCTNNGMQTWTYNQGVVLGGLVELSTQTGDKTLIDDAYRIATAAVTKMTTSAGILKESCEPGNCGGDGPQFKGVLARNIRQLVLAADSHASRAMLRDFLLRNADSVWAKDRNPANNQLGIVWSGPYNAGKEPSADTQSSAMDVLVAAMAVA